MKISAIMALMKKSKTINLYKQNGKQWISNGRAAYAVHCLPELDNDQLCVIAGIPESKAADYNINTEAEWLEVFNEKPAEGELLFERRNAVTYCTNGALYEALTDAEGRVWLVDTKYLRPIRDYDAEALSFYITKGSDKVPVIRVRAGLLLIAIITLTSPSKAFCDELKAISDFIQPDDEPELEENDD
ncbi:MAG: hypothetical protein IJ555_03035 [Ruminococcus sp.]|nr:hypothetical protein [Ruminococcus sp.]